MSETRTPRWVWGVIAGLVLVDPACHLWIYFRPPAGTVATGLHTFDSIVYLMAMRMLDTDFFNPFASCQSPLGTHGIAYYATPWFWLYALPGRLATLIGMPHFLMLSVMDSLGAAAYLYAVWRFLRTVFPSHARIAFLIWSLGGGIGGAVFAITGALGLWHWPGAEDQLLRFVMYDLVEGANVSPTTHFQRLYYTLSLAILFTAFTELAQAMRGRCGKRLAWSAFLLALGSLLHPRYGPMMVMIMGLYVLWQTDMAFAQRFRYACAMALAGAVGAGASMAIMRQAPGYVNNALILCRVATWPSPLVSAAFFHVFTVPLQIGRIARRMPFLARAIVCALGGYLVAYAPLYFGYQVYWGNLLAGREARVADVMSDWALFGALAGLVYARVRRPKTQDKALPELGWVALWALTFLVLTLAAFGQGWWLRVTPQRMLALLGLPLCILTAAQLTLWRGSRPRLARGFTLAMVACGAWSIAMGALFIQGPLFHAPGKAPFARWHAEIMDQADARLMGAMGPGVALAPPAEGPMMGDVVALRPGMSVVYGMGTMNFSERDSLTVERDTARFFSPNGTEDRRAELIRSW
ncbi:MAG TPA: hypothetical protein PKZ01_10065, partial [Candidatus Hydrogenedentes bacterium]|nr:hypothetical protein [Candidatus Hydrogenedentota bacterium]